MRLRWLVVVVALWALGCEDTDGAALGGETNWLKSCTVDSDCSVGSCVCGACSAECEGEAQCGDLPGAVCVADGEQAFDGQCGTAVAPPAGLCLPDCSDADCGAGQRCEGGACVVVPGGGSGGGMTLDNPSGDCTADGDGGRIGYHSPAGDTYYPDCQNTLAREFWRIFMQDNGDVYMIPRPDGGPGIAEACADAGHPLNAALNTYTLCQEITQPSAVNAMVLDDAFEISRLLHGNLIFENDPQGGTFALPDDILDACKADEAFRTGPMSMRCGFEIQAEMDGERNDIGWIHDGEQGTVLAAKMNELYGITGDAFCERAEASARRAVGGAIAAADMSCSTDDDCVGVAHSSACHDSCGRAVASSAAADIDAARVNANARSCDARAAAGCPDIIIPPCPPPVIRCVDNMCQDG